MLNLRKVYSYLFFASVFAPIIASLVGGYFGWGPIAISLIVALVNTMAMNDHAKDEKKVTTRKDTVTLPAGVPEERLTKAYPFIAFVGVAFLIIGPLMARVCLEMWITDQKEINTSYYFCVNMSTTVLSYLSYPAFRAVLWVLKHWWNAKPVKLVRSDLKA